MPPIYGEPRVSGHHKFYPDWVEFVQNEVREGRAAPLHWDLWREARDHVSSNPRSAIVLAVAAAEIGFKQCIIELIPAASCLVESTLTPPLTDMLKNYLPQLPVKCTIDGRALSPPRNIRSTLDQAIQHRNALVHRPKAGRQLIKELTGEEVQKLLDVVEDLLWMYDYYSGNEWASHFISDETKAAWERTDGAGAV